MSAFGQKQTFNFVVASDTTLPCGYYTEVMYGEAIPYILLKKKWVSVTN